MRRPAMPTRSGDNGGNPRETRRMSIALGPSVGCPLSRWVTWRLTPSPALFSPIIHAAHLVTLATGVRLGPYKIVALLGTGGMDI